MKQFTQGFSSLKEEIVVERLPIQGRIPVWLSGTLLRNGPAQFEVGARSFRHWFDGFAMMHRFSFQNGEVSYANKFLRSKAYDAAQKTSAISYAEFATDPCRRGFRRAQTLFRPSITDNANVNVGAIADQFVAMTETPLPIIFDPKTLETLGVVQYEDHVRGILTTAHPHDDTARQEIVNYLTKFSGISTYQIYRMPYGLARREIIARIKTREPSYMHSFALTEHYIILAAYPFVINPLTLLLSGKPFIENFRWKPERGTLLYVVDRKTGRMVKMVLTDAFFAFHHINAFEHGDQITVDVAAYPNPGIIGRFYLDALRSEVRPDATMRFAGEFRRYHISLGHAGVQYETMTEALIELPRINGRFRRKQYTFAYGTSHDAVAPDFLDRLIKIDIRKEKAKMWHESSCYPGEPIFVASPKTNSEDDGVILSVVLNTEKGNSYLLILDAQSFQEIGRAEVPHHIPFGFHGQFTAEI